MPVSTLRVVLDTNVIISASWGGIPGQVLEAWFEGKYTLLISWPIFAEYSTTLRKLQSDPAAASNFLHAVYLGAVFVKPSETLRVIRQDPSDNRFLECAVTGEANAIVSGDRHLLKLEQFREIRILTPREFLETLA